MRFKVDARRLLGLPPKRMRTEFRADGLGVIGKNLGFMEDPAFRIGWQKAVDGNLSAWGGTPPDIRWRAHAALWAARHGLNLEGDFVECGVFLGLLSLTICHALEIEKSNKTFYLFDTYNGMPSDSPNQKTAHLYFDCYEQAKKNFAPFNNAHLVRGVLPDSLSEAPLKKIAYLSIDLNHAPAERAVIDELWEHLTPSAIVLIDDYAFRGHEDQYATWNDFAAANGVSILTIPTGQGILIKP